MRRTLRRLRRPGVYVDPDFPRTWQITLTRSSDGTPLVDVHPQGGPDPDLDPTGRLFLRVYASAEQVHEHLSPQARRWRAHL